MDRARIVTWGKLLLRRSGPPPPPLSRWALIADAALAVALMVAAIVAARYRQDVDIEKIYPGPYYPGPPIPPLEPPYGPPPGEERVSSDFHQLILPAVAGLALIARRRYPLSVFWIVLSATLIFHIEDRYNPAITFTCCIIAAYSAAIHSPYRNLSLASLAVGGVLLAVFHEENVPDIKAGPVPLVVLILIGVVANAIHTWRQRLDDLQGQQDAATRLAVERERSRIARELHDVVTHNVSMMVVQAGAARKVMDAAPDKARDALLAVENGGRAALAELRHVMGLLTMTSDDDPTELTPQPSLSQVPALAERLRATGVDVELITTGIPTPLAPGVDLAAYRVVQEALTNTVKHAAGASVKITIDYQPDAVRLDIADSGALDGAGSGAGSGPGPVPSSGDGGGRGLIGLRERLAVYGGTLDAGARPTGGFRVRAVIPVEQP